ncbi:MAG: hypothetical protein QW117_02165 [Candidatus Pacearchaeota archaeon]
MLSKERISLLYILINSLEQISRKLEEYYTKKDIENYEKTKKEIIKINSQISKLLT